MIFKIEMNTHELCHTLENGTLSALADTVHKLEGRKIQKATESLKEPEPAPAPPKEKQPTQEPKETPEPEPGYTLEEVRAKLAAVGRGGKREAVKALLKKWGYEKVTEIKPGDYAGIMEEVDTL